MLKNLTYDILNKCIDEVNKIENKQKINKYIISPIINDLTSRIYPYVIILFVMYILILILIIAILIMLILNKK
jgi:hypothetical protein